MKKWVCSVCGYVHEGDTAPEKCPICKAPAEKFVLQAGDISQHLAACRGLGIKMLYCFFQREGAGVDIRFFKGDSGNAGHNDKLTEHIPS